MQLMVVRMSDKDSEWAKNVVSLYGVHYCSCQRRLHKLYRNNFINSCFGLMKYFVYDRKKWHVLPNNVQSQPYYVFLTKRPINMETAVADPKWLTFNGSLISALSRRSR